MRSPKTKKGNGLFKAVLVVAVLYFFAGFLTGFLTDRYLPAIQRSGLKSGAAISDITFQKPGLASVKSVKWESVSARLKPQSPPGGDREFSFMIDRLELDFGGILEGIMVLKGSNMSLSQLPPALRQGKPEPRKVKSVQGDFSYRFKIEPLGSSGIAAAIRKTVRELSALVREGRCDLDLDYRGTSYFSIKGGRFYAELFTVREGDGVRLVMDSEGVRMIALQLDEELTDSEVLMLSRNPVKAPRLFEIKEYAKKKASEAAAKDAGVPEDAYKHVLWSYLLGKEYGEEFSKEVTDAHEEGARKNTEADHLMDYQNNVVGRRYALEKVEEKDVLGRLLKDPSVVRSAGAALAVKKPR